MFWRVIQILNSLKPVGCRNRLFIYKSSIFGHNNSNLKNRLLVKKRKLYGKFYRKWVSLAIVFSEKIFTLLYSLNKFIFMGWGV